MSKGDGVVVVNGASNGIGSASPRALQPGVAPTGGPAVATRGE